MNGSYEVSAVANRHTAASHSRVRVDPRRVALRLAQRLHEIRLESFVADRPRADERLVDEQLLDPVGRALAAQRRSDVVPAFDEPAPASRGGGERAQAGRARRRCASCRGSARRAGCAGSARARSRWPRGSRRRARRTARVAADLVEREQPDVPVEGGVLDALGHDRPRRLLETGDELGARRVVAFQEEQRAQGRRDARQRAPIGVVDPARRGFDVAAVDGSEASARAISGSSSQAAQPLHLGRERRLGLLELGLGRDLGERAVLAGRAR